MISMSSKICYSIFEPFQGHERSFNDKHGHHPPCHLVYKEEVTVLGHIGYFDALPRLSIVCWLV